MLSEIQNFIKNNKILCLLCILVWLAIFLVSGCTTVKYVDKKVEVEVPVVVPIQKPERPAYTKKDTTITYMMKVLEYTKILETLINEHNNMKKED